MTERIQPEEIGALLDGRVQEPRRAELLAVLATADEDYELFIDTAAVLREAEEEKAEKESIATPDEIPASPVKVIPLHPGRTFGWRSPVVRGLAAAAVLAAIALPVLRARRDARAWEDPSRMAVLASPSGAGLPPRWQQAGATRGGGTAAGAGAAAHIGALQVDLAVAAASADFDRASLLASRIAVYLGDIQGAGPLGAQYGAVAEAARSRDPRLAALVTAAGRDFADFAEAGGSADLRALGAWTEAARLAAARQDAAFFRAPESRHAVVRAASVTGLSAEATRAAASLRSLVHDHAEIRDWTALRRELDSLQAELAR